MTDSVRSVNNRSAPCGAVITFIVYTTKTNLATVLTKKFTEVK